MDRFYAVKAAASGTVLELSINNFDRNTGWDNGIPSNTVLLMHDDGTYTYYFHMMKKSATVKLGEHVLQGKVLGYTGSSGNSTDAHLHFEPVYFTNGNWVTGFPVSYDFITSKTKAYGDYLKLKSGEYCFYSRDMNQSGSIDLTDLLQVYNISDNFYQSTYAVTDTNGDGITDLTDILITYNNSINFISKMRP